MASTHAILTGQNENAGTDEHHHDAGRKERAHPHRQRLIRRFKEFREIRKSLRQRFGLPHRLAAGDAQLVTFEMPEEVQAGLLSAQEQLLGGDAQAEALAEGIEAAAGSDDAVGFLDALSGIDWAGMADIDWENIVNIDWESVLGAVDTLLSVLGGL